MVDDGLVHAIDSGIWETAAWKAGKEEDSGPHSSDTRLTLRIEFPHGAERDLAWAEYGWGDE